MYNESILGGLLKGKHFAKVSLFNLYVYEIINATLEIPYEA